MGVEGRRRGVLQVAAHHDAAPQTGLFGAHHERLVALAIERLADGSVAGLVARCKRRRRGGRVGHAVVGRARADQPHALCAVERGRRVAVLDHQHRDMGQTHAVAHHENQVADLALGVRGPDTAPRKEAQRPDKQDCRSLLHNRYKDSPFPRRCTARRQVSRLRHCNVTPQPLPTGSVTAGFAPPDFPHRICPDPSVRPPAPTRAGSGRCSRRRRRTCRATGAGAACPY